MNCAVEHRFSEDAVRRTGNPHMIMKTPSEVENEVFSKASSKVSEDVLIYVSHSTEDLIHLFIAFS